jgi:hypothetical protein
MFVTNGYFLGCTGFAGGTKTMARREAGHRVDKARDSLSWLGFGGGHALGVDGGADGVDDRRNPNNRKD